MAPDSKRNFISSLKGWYQRYNITVINALVTVILVGIVVFVLLNSASDLQRRTVEESVVNLAGMTANEVQANYANYFNIARTMAQIMRNYQTIEVERRRTYFNDIMLGILNANSALVSIYTILRPHELDDMDAEYANTDYSDETGQYITGFTREQGWVAQRAFAEYKYLLDAYSEDISGYDNTIIGEPRLMPIGLLGTNVWVIDMQIPIMRDAYYAIGLIGVTINLTQLQFLVESRNPYGDGRTMVVSEQGNIVAHYNPQLRGFNLSNTRFDDHLFSADTHAQIFQVAHDSIDNREPTVLTTRDTLIVSYPLEATNSYLASFTSFIWNETSNPPWAVITMVPLATIFSPINTLIRFSVVFIIGAGILAAVVVFLTSSRITQRARFLQRDLERATTMQNNLKYGLFLMNQKFIIQGAYSKALEKILSISDLQGKSFLDLLSDSIKDSEQGGLADYFGMIFKRSFDKDMLESINPINEFVYTSIESGEVKNLRSTFTLTEWGRGTSFILGTLEDITAEKELEQQLLEADTQREKEMKALFQVIQLDPRVLSDFIEDAEYEFDQINGMLKNREKYSREVLVQMYQSIHAIKSNALILNLDNFSNRLHKMESSIKNLRERDEKSVTIDDFLGLLLEVNEVMKEKDQLKAAIGKITNFRSLSGKGANQEQYVLVETLTQVCKKAQAALDKKARLVVEKIDSAAFDYGPRRVIKEVLTQLVRNAVYHGIEPPDEREAAGKEGEGEIRLSVRHGVNEIIIQLSDNGRGLDFGHIRQKALANNLFANPAEADERSNLIQALFMPGFSTAETTDLHAGRGVGLSLVRDRIRKLHGRIKVTTDQGKGTTFVITIPLETEAVSKAS